MPVNAAPQRVQVFALGKPRAGADRDSRRHYVKWRVDGRDRTRSFKTKAEAERFRTSLLAAVQQGERFDSAAGVPASWVQDADAPTWWTWSRDWLTLKWPQWSGHSRRSSVESLTALTPLLVRRGAPAPPDELAGWLRQTGFQPNAAISGRCAEWLSKWSIRLNDIDPGLLERVLHATTTKSDGTTMAPDVVRRRRNTLGAVLRAAVRRELLNANPLERVEWRAPARTLAVDVSTVPSPDDVRAAVDHVAALSTEGARYAALFAAVGIGGMRPSEAIGLRVSDLDLPDRGWGMATLRGALTSPGMRYTAGRTVVEAKGLKQRAAGAVRDVPLAPALVIDLRRHLDKFPPVDGRVLSNAAGRPMTTTGYGPVWVRARRSLWPAPHPLASATVYDLRHAAATLMLRANVPPAEVARRLGHSVDVLMRVYAGVFDDERQRSNQLIDRALRTKKVPAPTRR